jgi:nucleotide-binding universal stress UspA family protein
MTATGCGPMLLCYDGSEGARRAIERAGALLPGSDAIVLHLWDSPAVSGVFATPAHGAVVQTRRAAEVAGEGAELARAAGFSARPFPAGIGASWESVLAVAEAEGAGLIVIGARGLTGARAAVLGSLSRGVTQHARVPVLVVPPPSTQDEAFGDVLVHAVSRMGGSQRADALARYVILEAGKGRDLGVILEDAYVLNHRDRGELEALLDRKDVIDAIGRDATRDLRARISERA